VSEQEWRERALAAEAKVTSLRKLYDQAATARAAWADWDGPVDDQWMVAPSAARLISEMEAMGHLLDAFEHVLPARDYFDQKTSLFEIRTANIDVASIVNVEQARITLSSKLDWTEKMIAFVYQVVQLADMASADEMKQPVVLGSAKLHLMASTVTGLLASASLLPDELGITPETVMKACEKANIRARAERAASGIAKF
jgi:hypothetical protein